MARYFESPNIKPRLSNLDKVAEMLRARDIYSFEGTFFKNKSTIYGAIISIMVQLTAFIIFIK